MYTIDEKPAWAERTAPEIRELGDRSGSVLVVPVGSIEQHGNHMPVGTDSILADAIASGGAARAGDDVPVLVTPPVWTGSSPHHLSLGGTISLSHDGLLDLLREVADTALENGFDGILFVNGHGGNAAIVSTAVNAIGEEHADVESLGVTYFELAAPFVDEIRDSEIGGMAHAGEFETSLMLHLCPDLVREDEMEATMLEEPYEDSLSDMYEGGPISVYREFESFSETGAIGAPELATAEKGAELYDRLCDRIADVVREIHETATD
jgi:creatinine amidohydrolase